MLSIRRVKHCAKRLPSHNRYDGLGPVYRRGSRGSGRGGALPRSQDSKTSGTDCRKVKDLSQLPVGLQQKSRGGEFRMNLQPLGQNPRSGGNRRQEDPGPGLPSPNLQGRQNARLDAAQRSFAREQGTGGGTGGPPWAPRPGRERSFRTARTPETHPT